MHRASLERLAALASVVFIADFASKRWALDHLDGSAPLGRGLHFAVVNNTRLAWGLETGGFELEVTVLATIAIAVVVARIARQLAAVDPGAPLMLALLLGAGSANLADALIPPHGVVDFIAITGTNGNSTAFNVADIAAALGLALCARTVWRIAQAMRGHRVQPAPRPAPSVFARGVVSMRQRLLVSGGHALFAMCAFVWVYSMAIAWTPDAGSGAPSALLLGVGVFGAAFFASQGLLHLKARSVADVRHAHQGRMIERVVLDGSLAAGRTTPSDGETPARERRPRREMPLSYEPRPSSDVRGEPGDRA